MHLVKWIRKNMSKLMAVFVILIMVAFIVPQLLTQLSRPKFGSPDSAMWLYGNDGEISPINIKQATNELAVLKALYADRILFSQKDIKLVLLGQMLFGSPTNVPPQAVSDQIKQIVMQTQLPVSVETVDEFFAQTKGKAELYWLLLKNEAAEAGIQVSTSQVSNILKNVVPQITDGKTDAATLVKNLSTSYQMTEAQVLQVFAQMLAVSSYAETITNGTEASDAMIRNIVATEKGTFNCEFVSFAAETFTGDIAEPGKEKIAAQFDKYKEFFANTITAENSAGFGYKIPARVQLEYAMVKIEDVEKLVKAPTPEETENFYQSSLEFFTEKVAKNPDDPNSEMVERQKSYAEVAESIATSLMARKISAKASSIINEIIDISEADFVHLDFETATDEDFKAKMKSYTETVKTVAAKYDIKIYAGKTGLITANQLASDMALGRCVMPGQTRMPSPLVNLVFAIEQLGVTKLSPFENVKPKLYLSMSTLYDQMGQLASAVRVVDYSLPSVPENVDFSYEKNLPVISDNDIDAEANIYSTAKLVAEDVKRIEAYEIAKQKAAEFMAKVATADDWQSEIDKLNKANPSEMLGETFALANWTDRKRLSLADIQNASMATADNINADMILGRRLAYKNMIDSFLANIAPGKLAPAKVPFTINFAPGLTCHVIKSLERKLPTTLDYQESRQIVAYTQDYINSQAAAFEHFMPENITTRMNFRVAEPAETTDTEPNTPVAETE